MSKISAGTGWWLSRLWCRIARGHNLGVIVPDWFKGGGRICIHCGGVYR